MRYVNLTVLSPLNLVIVAVAAVLVIAPLARAGSPAGDTVSVSGHNFPDDYGRPTVDENMPPNGIDDVFDFTMGAGLPVTEGVTTQVGDMDWTIGAQSFMAIPGGINVNTPPGNPLAHDVFDNPGQLIEITFDANPTNSGLQSFSDSVFDRWGFAVEGLEFLDETMTPETAPLIVWDSTLYFYPRSYGFALDPSLFQSSFTIGPHPTDAGQNVIYLNVADADSLDLETVYIDGVAQYAVEPEQTDLLEAGSMELALFALPIDELVVGILVTQTIPGDANLDLLIGPEDYTLWANHFGIPDATFQDGDYNNDGMVGPEDYTLWANNFGMTAGGDSPAPQAVPEPACFALLGLGVLCVSAMRSRRTRSC